MKIRALGAELLNADGQTDRHDELIVAFRNLRQHQNIWIRLWE